MSVFKENLTSKILQKESLKILNRSKKNLNILELGCGNGNISNFLIKNCKNKNHKYFLSDISTDAIKAAKKNINKSNVTIKKGSLYEPWKKNKFDIIISDVSSIADDVAKYSDWYVGVKCDSGKDGLNNIKKILKETKNYLNKNGKILFPVISLCNVKKLKKLTLNEFQSIKYSSKNSWPLPKFFSKKIDIFLKLKRENLIEFEIKFGIYIAYTYCAICQKIR